VRPRALRNQIAPDLANEHPKPSDLYNGINLAQFDPEIQNQISQFPTISDFLNFETKITVSQIESFFLNPHV
jgi:hypothetical protein